MVEVNGKQYADTVEYALDTRKYDKVVDEHTKTINISPCWNDWEKVVEKNKPAFEKMTVNGEVIYNSPDVSLKVMQ